MGRIRVTGLLRGQVIRAEVGLDEPKLFVVLSNNRRNANFSQVLAARLSTTPKPEIPSVVKLGNGESVGGRVICDDILEIYEDEVLGVVTAFSPGSMREVSVGLKAALDLH